MIVQNFLGARFTRSGSPNLLLAKTIVPGSVIITSQVAHPQVKLRFSAFELELCVFNSL